LAGLILAFFIKGTKPMEQRERMEKRLEERKVN
jgi:hypothetical protein